MRQALASNIVRYLSPSGSDLNDGQSPETPWRSRQYAYERFCRDFDLNGFTATAQLLDGTYTDAFQTTEQPLGAKGCASIVFQGNATSRAAVIVPGFDFGGGAACRALATIKNMKIADAAKSGVAAWGAALAIGNVEFGACSLAHLYAAHCGEIMYCGNLWFSAGAAYSLLAQTGGLIAAHTWAHTYTNTPAFSGANMSAQCAGQIYCGDMTFSGGVSGPRYLASQLGLIVTGTAAGNPPAGDPEYIPGSAAGAAWGGGQYL